MTDGQEQTAGDWQKLQRPAERPGPRRDERKNSAVERGRDRSPDLLQMLRAAESRRGAPHSPDRDPTEGRGPAAEAQRMDLVSWEVNVVLR